jgi:hypothetical protein
MARRRRQLGLALLVLAFWASSQSAGAQVLPFLQPRTDQWQRLRAASLVPLEQVPASLRAEIRLTIEKPTLFTSGPAETFACQPELYSWLLDHPDRAVTAWRRLGAVCLDITPRGPGRFGWSDDLGNDLWWETVYKAPGVQVWYAQGKVKPSPVLPLVPVRAVVVLRYSRIAGRGESAQMHHQADVFVHTDSKAAALATRLMGPAAPRMAEEGVSQMQMFFSALAWYCERYPERAQMVLEAMGASRPVSHSAPVLGARKKSTE